MVMESLWPNPERWIKITNQVFRIQAGRVHWDWKQNLILWNHLTRHSYSLIFLLRADLVYNFHQFKFLCLYVSALAPHPFSSGQSNFNGEPLLLMLFMIFSKFFLMGSSGTLSLFWEIPLSWKKKSYLTIKPKLLMKVFAISSRRSWSKWNLKKQMAIFLV